MTPFPERNWGDHRHSKDGLLQSSILTVDASRSVRFSREAQAAVPPVGEHPCSYTTLGRPSPADPTFDRAGFRR